VVALAVKEYVPDPKEKLAQPDSPQSAAMEVTEMSLLYPLMLTVISPTLDWLL
jgi:hypothetical protein